VKATGVIAGLAESNGILPPGGWLKVTCRLTACRPTSKSAPANARKRVWENLTLVGLVGCA